MNLYSVSVHKQAKKELGQYPANMTSCLVNNPYIHTYKRKRPKIATIIKGLGTKTAKQILPTGLAQSFQW